MTYEMNVNSFTTRLGSMIAAVLLFTGTSAFAQSPVSYSYTFGPLTDPIGQSIHLAQFNDMGGTLQLDSVTLQLSNVFVSGTASVTNNNPTTPRNYTIALNGDYTLSDTLGNAAEVSVISPSFSTPTPLAPNATFTTPPTSNSTAGGSTMTFTDSATKALYTGTGYTDSFLNLSSFSGVTVFSGPSPYSITASSSGTGTVTVIYNYSPVPEPATTAAWMLGFGLCLLAGRRFYRGSKQTI